MASWTGVTTNAGVRLMASWTSGTTLNIDKAVAGEGCAPIVSLLAQTALVKEKQEISIVSSKIENDARKIKVQIQSGEEGYLLNQIGLFASVDGGEQVLLALFQNERGIDIPSFAESPDFLYTFYCLLTVSNQGDFSITVNPSALVSYGAMKDFVEEETKGADEHILNKNNPHEVTADQVLEDVELPQEWNDINEAYEAIKEDDHKLLGGVIYKDFEGNIRVFPLSPPYGIRTDEVGDEYAQSAIAMYNSRQQLLVKPATDDRHAVPLSQLIEKLGMYLAKTGGIMTGKPEIKTSNPAVKLTDTTDGNAAAYFQTYLGKAYFGYSAANSLSVDKEGNAKVVGTLTVGGSLSCTEIDDLKRRLNALADSDDITLDQLSEIVAYIKSNKSLIDSITTSKVSVNDIIDNLTSTETNKPLSAAQGAKLKKLIDSITVPTETEALNFTYEDGTTRTLEVYIK